MSPINYERSMMNERGVYSQSASQLLHRKTASTSDQPSVSFVLASPVDIQKQIPPVSQDFEPLATPLAGSSSQTPQPSIIPFRTISTFPLQSSFHFEDRLLAASNEQSSSPINAATTTATILTTVYMTVDASSSPSSNIPSSSASVSNSIRIMTILGLTLGGILLIAALVGLTLFIRRWRRIRRNDAETGRMSEAVTQFNPRMTIDDAFQPPQIQAPPPLVSVRASLPPPPYHHDHQQQPSSGRPSVDSLKGNSWGSSRSGLRSLYLSNMP
ncbi:hypothetical protein Clacol_004008 [Clathrus columnatus]|uniref:Uncharacterized protein n=1 Tax=Clathrus columnatus TaxID=1419009 RepID=A0AAV5A996_9AGAM|nr:hypothetical protein Clacol_004008 [Clathrus columnatus]